MKRIFHIIALLSVVVLPCMAQYPATPQPQERTADRKFIFSAAIDLSASLADAAVSSRLVSGSTICNEIDPLYGRHPSAGRYFGQMIATTAALDLLAYVAKKHRQSWWTWPIVIDVSQHVGGVIATSSHCRR